jgi:hypothetical protein
MISALYDDKEKKKRIAKDTIKLFKNKDLPNSLF